MSILKIVFGDKPDRSKLKASEINQIKSVTNNNADILKEHSHTGNEDGSPITADGLENNSVTDAKIGTRSVGEVTKTLTQWLEWLVGLFAGTGGHGHTGADGDGAQIGTNAFAINAVAPDADKLGAIASYNYSPYRGALLAPADAVYTFGELFEKLDGIYYTSGTVMGIPSEEGLADVKFYMLKRSHPMMSEGGTVYIYSSFHCLIDSKIISAINVPEDYESIQPLQWQPSNAYYASAAMEGSELEADIAGKLEFDEIAIDSSKLGGQLPAYYAKKAYNAEGGGAVGTGAEAFNGGGAVGYQATASHGFAGGNGSTAEGGGAVGKNAAAAGGFSGGDNAFSAVDSIQLGSGENEEEHTLKVYATKIVNADGKLTQLEVEKAAANGIATLGADGLIPAAQLPYSLGYLGEVVLSSPATIGVSNMDFTKYKKYTIICDLTQAGSVDSSIRVRVNNDTAFTNYRCRNVNGIFNDNNIPVQSFNAGIRTTFIMNIFKYGSKLHFELGYQTMRTASTGVINSWIVPGFCETIFDVGDTASFYMYPGVSGFAAGSKLTIFGE